MLEDCRNVLNHKLGPGKGGVRYAWGIFLTTEVNQKHNKQNIMMFHTHVLLLALP